jgi:hypothetical protein
MLGDGREQAVPHCQLVLCVHTVIIAYLGDQSTSVKQALWMPAKSSVRDCFCLMGDLY